MIRLNGIDIILTYECTNRCSHCCYRGGPGRDHTMSLPEVEGYLAGIEGHRVKYILLFGGEPFLCYNLLRDSVKAAASLAKVLVFTNGFWAEDLGSAKLRLSGLQEAGLDQILFSVDSFHQRYVPLERIAVGITAAQELGYGTIEIDNRFLVGSEADNPHDRKTGELMARLTELCELRGVHLHRGPSRVIGRASDELSRELPNRSAFPASCPLPDYLGADLRAPTGVEIHPGGWVNLCEGLALGNAQQTGLGEILEGYSVEAHPVISVLAEEGPSGLLRLAGRHGFTGTTGHVSACHLCYEVRRFLQPLYPDLLSPAAMYDETL
jgi:hypothetical protein